MIDKTLETNDKKVSHNNTFRETILDFEKHIENIDGAYIGDSVMCPLKHSFSDGIYVREIFIPKRTILTGKIHKHRHPNFLMSGLVDVVTEDGGHERLSGPCSIMSPAGTKRALRAVTDLVWITVHHNPTNTQNLKVLEEIVIADTYKDYERFVESENNKQLVEEEVKHISLWRRIINKIKGGKQ